MEDIETQKLRLEEKRIDNEYSIKQAEIALKRDEIEAKIKADEKANRNKGLSPILATILVAIFGLLGTGTGAILQGWFNMSLERQKFEAALISKALEPEDENKRAKQLDFYTKIGLITDERVTSGLKQFIANPSRIPQVNRDHFGANYNLGVSYRKMGQIEQALLAFEKALEISPNDSRTHYNIANIYQQKDEASKAKEHYKKVIELEPAESELSQRAKKNLKVLGE